MSIELEMDRALLEINVKPESAQAVAESINREIDRRYALHEKQLFTKMDGAELEARLAKMHNELVKWVIASIFASVGLFAAIAKFFH